MSGRLNNRGPIKILFFILKTSPVSNNFMGPPVRKMTKKGNLSQLLQIFNNEDANLEVLQTWELSN